MSCAGGGRPGPGRRPARVGRLLGPWMIRGRPARVRAQGARGRAVVVWRESCQGPSGEGERDGEWERE